MEPFGLPTSLACETEIKGIRIKAGARKNYDTMVEVRVGPIVITEVQVLDDHLVQATAYLPPGIQASDSDLDNRITAAALSLHFGIDEV
jgi:hypothetical protein